MKHLSACALATAALGLAAPAFGLQSQLVASGLSSPVFLTAPAGDSRLFVVERAGRIKVLQGGVASTYLDISAQVATEGERGLLGLAFAPDFASSGRFYVDYIDRVSNNTVVAAYTAPSAAAPMADPSSARTIITIAQPPGRNNHKAGWIGFRPGDAGQLYIATGDGGAGNDPENRAQNLNDNLGKMLRVTPNPAGGGYSVPAGNPYAGATPGNDEIWASGLRNPFRDSFDRQTGDLWIGDVGQSTREEIDFEAAGTPGGRNYGWRALEGSADNPANADPVPADATAPLFDYPHGTAMGQTVIGGYVYRGGAEAGLDGTYFFGDFISGKIFSLRRNGASFSDLADRTAELGTPFGGFQLVSFGEDGAGALYAVGQNGNVFRIAAAAVVPEPATWLLMALGGAALAAARRRGVGRG